MSELISIVLPVYNGEKYLRESIDSILKQTYKNWELLILDDCSNDKSPEISKEYLSKDNRIRYYRNEKNLGLPRNLNKGFSLAKGAYLTWTSDDNRFKPSALERMYDTIKQKNVQFVFAACRIIDEEGKEIEYISVGKDSVKDIVGSNSVGACFLYSRKVYESVGDYDPSLVLVEDFDYWQRIISEFSAVPISEYLYEYRWHSEALTSTMKKEVYYSNLEKMLKKNLPRFGKLNIRQKYLLYRNLAECRRGENICYNLKKHFYTIIYFIIYRVPRKVQRIATHYLHIENKVTKDV